MSVSSVRPHAQGALELSALHPLDLARQIRETVNARFGVMLENEPVLVGVAL